MKHFFEKLINFDGHWPNLISHVFKKSCRDQHMPNVPVCHTDLPSLVYKTALPSSCMISVVAPLSYVLECQIGFGS